MGSEKNRRYVVICFSAGITAHCLAAGQRWFNDLMAASALWICAAFLLAITETYLDCSLDNRADDYCSSFAEANLRQLDVSLKWAELS